MPSSIQSFFTSRALRGLVVVLGLAGVYASGLTVRRLVLEAQQTAIGEDMPFTLESALHYRRIKILHDRGFLPDIDPAIQHPEGIRIREIDSVASEPVQSFLARLFPESMPFSARIRWIEAGWFCLSLPLLALLMRTWTGSWAAGAVASLLYAVSLASVLRSTGQEISRENFALPWLLVGYVCAAGALRSERRHRYVAWSIGASAGLALALIGWDMIQYVIGVLALGMSIHVVAAGPRVDRRLVALFAYLAGGIMLTGLLHPYYRFHGLAYSPLMIWMLSILGASWWSGRSADATSNQVRTRAERPFHRPTHRLAICLIIFGPLAAILAFGLTGAYGASYEHFADLLYAKIKFLNVKPADPSLLNFYQRIMWVPSLHSATWGLTNWLFPFTLWVVIVIAFAAIIDSLKRPDPLIKHWLLLFGVSIAAYVFMVRFHVFVALGISVLAGWAMGRIRHAAIGWRAGLGLLMALAVMAEANHTLHERHRMGRPNVYYNEMRELAEWLRVNVAPDPVLANMGVSAYIAAYGKCPIAIHPKFEDASIRRRLETFGEIMFGTDEKTLRDWMDTLQLRHLVYARGEFASEKPEYQMRYFVNRMDPPESAPARRFEREDEHMRYFTRLWGNRKYVVYRALGGDEEQQAAAAGEAALEQLHQGDLDGAERGATEALVLDRGQETALRVMRHVGSLREQGFSGPRDGAAP